MNDTMLLPIPDKYFAIYLWQWHGDIFKRVSFSVPDKEFIGGFRLVNTIYSAN